MEIFGFFGIFLAISVAKIIINIWASKSPTERQRLLFKKRLTNWVKFFDVISTLGSALVIGILFFVIIDRYYLLLHPVFIFSSQITLRSALLFSPIGPIAIALGVLVNNILSWLITAIRKPNEAAARGLPGASFKKNVLSVLMVTLWIVLIGAGIIAIGFFV